MSLLITDPGWGVQVMQETDAQSRRIPCDLAWPCMPCACAELMAVACAQSRECLCMRGGKVISSMPCVPGAAQMCFSPCGRYLYQLSSEADSLHTRSAASGELLFAAPAGVFPRMMSMRGKYMLVAAGAVNEAYIMHLPDLVCERVIHTRHACFAADWWREGLLLVCAAQGEDIQTVVYTLPPHAVRPRKLIVLPGQPGALCMCPDGVCALLSTCDGLMKLDLLRASIVWNRPEWPLCMRLSCRGNMALISDTLDGGVWLIDHEHPWRRRRVMSGSAAQACFL